MLYTKVQVGNGAPGIQERGNKHPIFTHSSLIGHSQAIGLTIVQGRRNPKREEEQCCKSKDKKNES